MSEEAAVIAEEVPNFNAGDEKYAPEDVQVKRDAAHIRLRPGMYIGDTGPKGLHHLVNELVANSLDEALAGYCNNIHVRIHNDGSLSVSDDGRGIPVEMHPEENRPTLEVVMTTVGAGAKFSKGSYRVSAGLHGMGAKAVNALSEWTEVQVQRDGKTYRQNYERGKAVTGVVEFGASKHSGTTVSFKPDPEMFGNLTFDYDTIEERLRDLAYLNKGLTIGLHDERTNKEVIFKSVGGLVEFMEFLNRDETALHVPLLLEKVQDGISVSVAMQYTNNDKERFRCYTNNAFNVFGGTHLVGFRTALTRTFNKYGAKQDLFKNVTPSGEDYREGLTVIISVQHPDPQFDSQEKRVLTSLEVEGIVATVVSEFLSKFLEENPKVAQQIMKRVVLAAEAREAAAKARKALKDRKSILSGGGLPGKLFDCTERDPEKSELFLVEGDSAGGSAEAGRDRSYQAVLPLRGKPLNVEKARVENLLNNEEICSLISAIGIDIGNTEDIGKLRYSKVIIMTDADVDGQHIRTLLLTLFYRQMARLVADGHIYVARPPLFKVTQKKNVRFIQSNEEMTAELMGRGLKGTDLIVLPKPPTDGQPAPATQKFEGDDLAALVKLMARLEDSLVLVERSGLSLPTLLARVTPQGLPVYRVLLGSKEEWFFTQAEVDAFRQREQQRLGRELVVLDDATPAPVDGQTNGHAEVLDVRELHEVRKVNRALEELKKYGLLASDLIPATRVAGREPPPRLILENGDQHRQLPHLRDLVSEIRRIGERGLTITRFKGLGEMDPSELWETTLDPEKRTLMKVQLDDALKADELFRVLMGEDVKQRKDFIFKYGVKAKDIDYHGG